MHNPQALCQQGPDGTAMPDVCLPFNEEWFRERHGEPLPPLHLRHYLTVHADGYLQVYLGMGADGRPVVEGVHRLLALAMHGPPGQQAAGRGQHHVYHEASHVCDHPWCLNPWHIRWCSHKDNMNNGRMDDGTAAEEIDSDDTT